MHIFTYRKIITLIIATSAALIHLTTAHGAASAPDTWQEAAKKAGMDQTATEALERNRILITNDAYKQVFSAYIDSGTPYFITSDSILNTYHVLFEESVLGLETAQAKELPQILQNILTNLEKASKKAKNQSELQRNAQKRTMLVTGIALKLMDDSFKHKNTILNDIMDREVRKIKRSKGTGMPDWLGKPDHSFQALDYSRYKPRGFYTCSKTLQRYFRTVSWLQSIPFRISKDEEFLAILMLGDAITTSNRHENKRTQTFFRAYGDLIGVQDDWDIVTASKIVRKINLLILKRSQFPDIRADFLSKHGRKSKINDTIRFPIDLNNGDDIDFRIISAYRTPSAVLFQQTTSSNLFDRAFPNGLEVPTALGSAYARANLPGPQRKELLEAIDSCQPQFEGLSLYSQYLYALRALLDEPEHDAPDFMKTDAWAAKSCNTALAGWAQLRHTWVLQSKQNAHYFCFSIPPKGFVEPEPEFYSRMAKLAKAKRRLLEANGPLEPDCTHIIQQIEDYCEQLKRYIDDASGSDHPYPASGLIDSLITEAPSKNKRKTKKYARKDLRWLTDIATELKRGRIKNRRVKGIIAEHTYDIAPLWTRFESVCRQLETIANKQLRQEHLSPEENRFICNYGKTIADIMMYKGDSYRSPRDNAPRIVDVYANPNNGKHLEVGIARPRKLFVLYPWKGQHILCTGAVLPYCEFTHSTRLTDQEWIKKLDSKERPPCPEWLAPIVTEGGLEKPTVRRH